MINFLNKFIKRTNNLDYIAKNIKNLSGDPSVKKIFDAINKYSSISEIRYVGGCVRKIIQKEIVDDIDLATNLEPTEVCEALKKYQIDFYKTGVEHGTITALIDNYKFEITSLREDVSTDGRHAQVKFTKDWKKDASRRDFTINALYLDLKGNIYDYFDGEKDLKNSQINFIGDAKKRIEEDYLRILRYFRFLMRFGNLQKIDKKALDILSQHKEKLNDLSGERVQNEMIKILSHPKSAEILSLMQNYGFLEIIFGFEITKEFIHLSDNYLINLSYYINDLEEAVNLKYKWKMSNKDASIIAKLVRLKPFYREMSEKKLIKIINSEDKEIAKMMLALTKNNDAKLEKFIDNYEKRIFPVKGRDLIEVGVKPDLKMGQILKFLEEEWEKSDYEMSKGELLALIG